MKDKLVLECWCIFATKLKVYENKIEVGKFFGISKTTVPLSKVAAVHSGLTGISLETSGGLKIEGIAPWGKKYNEVADLISSLIEKN